MVGYSEHVLFFSHVHVQLKPASEVCSAHLHGLNFFVSDCDVVRLVLIHRCDISPPTPTIGATNKMRTRLWRSWWVVDKDGHWRMTPHWVSPECVPSQVRRGEMGVSSAQHGECRLKMPHWFQTSVSFWHFPWLIKEALSKPPKISVELWTCPWWKTRWLSVHFAVYVCRSFPLTLPISSAIPCPSFWRGHQKDVAKCLPVICLI